MGGVSTGRERDFAERFRRVVERWVRDGEDAQKQVTRIMEDWADKRAGRRVLL